VVEPELDVHEIQGNSLRGFNVPALTLLGLKIDDPSTAKAWLSALSHRIDTLAAVHAYRVRRSFRSVRAPRTLLNVLLSAHGLDLLGVDLRDVEDGLFLNPMGSAAASLGDPVDASSEPSNYVLGKDWNDTPDILLIVGGDSAAVTRQFCKSLTDAAAMASCHVIYSEEGHRLDNEIEHFGFRDGISQVGVRGRLSAVADDYVTLRYLASEDPEASLLAKPGQPLVWPGQFLFGYPTQLAADPLVPGPVSDGGAAWMKNGSFVIFRRLRQDVAAFRAFQSLQATALTNALGRPVSEEEAGAILVGRWKDGTPTTLSPGGPDAATASDKMVVNNFAYSNGTAERSVVDPNGQVRRIPGTPDDHLGQRCPHFAHVRKVNPRDLSTDQGLPGRTLTFQMLRRGIPYGPPFDEATAHIDRGLLFIAYQTSFKRQFQVLNHVWMNNSSAPELVDEGFDLLVGQNPSGGARTARMLAPSGAPVAELSTDRPFVIPTGGGFFFSPSISFLREL
jgi:Dyp-type peroxidase family